MKRTKNKWTLVTALEEIWKQAKDSRLSEEYFAQVAEACAYVKSKLNISPIQSYIIAMLMDAGKSLFLRDISKYAGCSNIMMMSYKKDPFSDCTYDDGWLFDYIQC